MRVAMVNTLEQRGGAAKAANRLHKGVQSLGVNSRMFVQEKISDDYSILGPSSKIARGIGSIRPTLDLLPQLLVKMQSDAFSIAWLPNPIVKQISRSGVDLVHLHWINKGFLPIQGLKSISQPILWTLHDMWAFTGGCHYDLGCRRYTERCGECPQIGKKRERDLSRWVWNRKNSSWRNLDFTIVCPSTWLANCVRESSLFGKRRIDVIAYGIDLARFRPIDRAIAREWLGLPKSKILLMFNAVHGTTNLFKGYQFLEEILANLEKLGWENLVELIVVGSSRPKNAKDLAFPIHYLGHIYDEISLALIYGATDLFLAPSIQDNLPNTIIESLACGTPCVAFSIGGIPDQIDHKINGYLAQAFDLKDFAQGIDWVIKDWERLNLLSINARKKAEKTYDIKVQAQLYLDLYREILTK